MNCYCLWYTVPFPGGFYRLWYLLVCKQFSSYIVRLTRFFYFRMSIVASAYRKRKKLDRNHFVKKRGDSIAFFKKSKSNSMPRHFSLHPNKKSNHFTDRKLILKYSILDVKGIKVKHQIALTMFDNCWNVWRQLYCANANMKKMIW